MTTLEFRAKYKQADRDDMAKQGQAMSDGSYPIKDAEDLHDAIHAVGRGGASHDAIRKHIIARAKALGMSSQIPDNWNADGSLSEQNAKKSDCPTCDGKGVVKGQAECPSCNNGSGKSKDGTKCPNCDGKGVVKTQNTCPNCKGAGTRAAKPAPCDTCDGTGKIRNGTRKCPTCGGSGNAPPEDAPSPSDDEENALSMSFEQRQAKVALLSGHLERRDFAASAFELRADKDSGTLKFSGYASLTETPYNVGFYTETIKRGAFKRTLAEKPDVQMLINHGEGGSGMPIARTGVNMTLTEDERGLKVDADLDPEDPDVQLLARKMASGLMNQMSFAFQANDQDWNDDLTERSIKSVSIHRGDVSIVNQGASPTTWAKVA